MRVFLSILINLLLLTTLGLGLAYFTNSGFLDYAFFIGAVVTISIWFFTSKGGLTSRNMDAAIQGTTGHRENENRKFEFSISPSFITSLLFTIFTFIAMLYQYRDYF